MRYRVGSVLAVLLIAGSLGYAQTPGTDAPEVVLEAYSQGFYRPTIKYTISAGMTPQSRPQQEVRRPTG